MLFQPFFALSFLPSSLYCFPFPLPSQRHPPKFFPIFSFIAINNFMLLIHLKLSFLCHHFLSSWFLSSFLVMHTHLQSQNQCLQEEQTRNIFFQVYVTSLNIFSNSINLSANFTVPFPTQLNQIPLSHVSYFHYPFTSRRSFQLFPLPSHVNRVTMNTAAKVSVGQNIDLFGHMPMSNITGYMADIILASNNSTRM